MGLLEDMAPYTTGDILQRLPSAMPLSERERRKLVKKEMAGQDLTPEEARKVENDAARAEGWSDKAASTGLGLMAEATGVPSITRGADNIGRAYTEGDMARGLGGAGQIVMGAIPAASALRGPAAAALSALYGSAPRAAATTATLAATGLPMNINDATAASENKVASAVNSDPEVKRIREELAAIQKEREASSSAPRPGLGKEAANAARARSDAAFKEREDKANAALTEAQGRIRDGYMQNAPFRERNPGTAEALFGGAAALAGALPFANTVKTNLANRFVLEPAIAKQSAVAERYLKGGTQEPGLVAGLLGAKPQKIKADPERFKLEQDVLNRQIARLDGNQPSYLSNGLKGTGLMMESRMLPEEIDAITYPDGHPTRDAALKSLSNKDYYTSGIIPSLGAGFATSGIGTYSANLLTNKAVSPKMDRARAIADIGSVKQPGLMEQLAGAVSSRFSRQSPAGLMPEAGTSSAGSLPIPAAPAGPIQSSASPSYKTFQSIPSSERSKIRDSYIAERSLRGTDLPARATAEGIKAPYAELGVNMPVSQGRVKATNDAVNDFIKANGREPKTKADWAEIWGKSTLAVPAISIGAGLMDFNSR